jgi:hypothetical protein
MKWSVGALGLGLTAIACGGSVATTSSAPDGGSDASDATEPVPTRSVRADQLGEVCSIENDCGKPQVCADFDAVAKHARGAVCSPPDPCLLVKCLEGEECILRPGHPMVVECVD